MPTLKANSEQEHVTLWHPNIPVVPKLLQGIWEPDKCLCGAGGGSATVATRLPLTWQAALASCRFLEARSPL